MLYIAAPEPTSDDQPGAPAEAAGADRRTGRRHATVLLIGKVVNARGDSACLVHDISKSGMMARFATPQAVGDALRIEVRGLPAIEGTVRWVKGLKAGLQFAQAQDVDRVFTLRRDDGTVARPPRFPIEAKAKLRFDDRQFAGQALDISPGGAKIAADVAVARGQAGQLLLPDTGTSLYGTVCWTRDDRFGFRFCAPLPLATLSQIIGQG